jgi:high affinity Mn2+ porin
MRFPPAFLLLSALGAAAVPIPARAQEALAAAPRAPWSLHLQSTWIEQGHPSFDSPYEGTNSLTAASENDRTFSFSVFAGLDLGGGLDAYFDPEVFQGHALSNTLGMAGFPNGEGSKAAFPNLHYNTSRLYLQKSFGLGGEKEGLDDGQNQVAGTVDVNRLVFSLGKFAASDFFDGNDYSHDARNQFMNWALVDSASWDYPADVLGYTAGAVAEWNTKYWEFHYGFFMMPTESNGARLDPHLVDAHGQILELDRRYTSGERSGVIRPFAFWNEARMGNYADALALPSIATALTDTRAYRSKVGFGVSWNQELTGDLGAFARLSWDDGRAESFAFTEIDRSVAAGLSMSGARWGRGGDTLAAAGVVNGIAGDHQAYLAAGGTQGLILGDGGLRYGPEEIIEVYYRMQALRGLSVSPDFQYAVNPGYNRDRGPVFIYALRAHVEF